MEKNISENCDEVIDDLVNKYYDIFQEILDLSNFLENNIKNGRLNLSKTKYTLGSCERVSQLQYNWQKLENERALCKVEVSPEEIYGINIDQISKIGDSIPFTPVNDPIKWFGILSPQCLKDAQKDFQRAIALSVELASKRILLLALRSEICDKMKSRICE